MCLRTEKENRIDGGGWGWGKKDLKLSLSISICFPFFRLYSLKRFSSMGGGVMYIILTLGILESIIWVISFKLALYSFKGTYCSTCSFTASFAPKKIKTMSGFSWITSWIIFNPHLATNHMYIATNLFLNIQVFKSD